MLTYASPTITHKRSNAVTAPAAHMPAYLRHTGVPVGMDKHAGSRCACEGDCPKCAPLQRKLKIGTSDSRYEKEADQVAQRIVQMHPAAFQPRQPDGASAHSSALVQRTCQTCEEEESLIQPKLKYSKPARQEAGIAFAGAEQGGRPLNRTERAYFEPRFNQDLSHVRLHTHDHAARSAAQINAKAYTQGNHIAFAPGQYQPQSMPGQSLLAHELTHVVQQQGTPEAQQELGVSNVPTGSVQCMGPFLPALGIKYLYDKWTEDPENEQLLEAMLTSIRRSPEFALDILGKETVEMVWDNIYWFLVIFFLFMAAEAGIGALAASPTGVSQIAAIILQGVVIACLGFFVGVEAAGAVIECGNWIEQCKEADGDPEKIDEAAKTLLRMIRHIIFAILILLGARARWKGLKTQLGAQSARASAAEAEALGSAARGSGSGSSGSSPGVDMPDNFYDMTADPRYGGPRAQAPEPVGQAGSSNIGPQSNGTSALKYDPLIEIPPEPVAPPQPAPIIDPLYIPVTGWDVGAAASAGGSVSVLLGPEAGLQTDPERNPRRTTCDLLPILWPYELPVPPTAYLYRTTTRECDEFGTCRKGTYQRKLQARIREANRLGEPLPCEFTGHPHCCYDLLTSRNSDVIEPEIFEGAPYGYEDWTEDPFPYSDEDELTEWLEPTMSLPYAAHHIHPLFLGGTDTPCNLCAIEQSKHSRGHSKLSYQPEILPYYEQCGLTTAYIPYHPSGISYYIEGFK